jgi:ADP-ribose pyrophosphatase YjhB (NUDIX family)
MKIFALNLCLEFAIKESAPSYQFEPISFSELMGHLFKGSDFPDQQYYVQADTEKEFQQHVFDLQTNEVWRDLPLSISFLFNSEGQLENFLEGYRDLFREVDAAGGMVQNEKGDYLLIFNRGRWTLPKGGVEWREAIEEAAVREVKEETGLDELELLDKMGETYHTFRRGRNWVLKTTHWYHMKASSEATLIPQASEKIEAVQWKSPQQWLEVAENSYPLVRHLFEMEFARKLG